jgi:hypothetical protein
MALLNLLNKELGERSGAYQMFDEIHSAPPRTAVPYTGRFFMTHAKS